jgi:leucyl aminopeptidase
MLKLPLLEVRTSISGAIDTDLIAVFQDSAKKVIPPKGPYGGVVEKLRKSEAFTGKSGSLQFIRFAGHEPAENLLLLGLGQSAELTEEKYRVAGGQLWAKISAEKVKTVLLHVDHFFESKSQSHLSPIRCLRALAEGIVLSAYQYVKHTSKKDSANAEESPQVKVIFLTKEKGLKSQLTNEMAQVQAIGEAVTVTRNWSNEPSNFGTPIYFAEESKKLAKEYGLKYRVLTQQEAIRENMGLFIGVGQGAEREGRIVIVEYTPKNVKKAKTIALVGKGVTFDSGGISIKPSMKMEDMKHDMTGAATIMGATLLAAKWGVPHRIITIMAFTENMPDGNAIQPGNVLTSRNGKTVEIINTDAEGRLVLADVLDYAQDYKPDAVVDVATLTGAVSVALGKQCCAILGNEENLMDSIKRAGEVSGERIWQLPLYDEYFDDLKSDYADMKNSANDSNGGTIRGAIFLKQFIKKNVQWAHLDIAAMAYNLSHISYYPKRGASGAYVRTLAQFIADY